MSRIRSLSTIAIALGVGVFSSATLANGQDAKLAKLAILAKLAKLDKLDQRVQNIYELAMKGICETLEPGSILGPGIPNIYQFTFNYENENYPPRPFRLYEFPCTAGAYNFGNVYFGAGEYGEIRQIQFATPVYDDFHESDDFESPVTSINITGFTAYYILINPSFNAETNTLYSFSKWRGGGDASSSGQWVFDEGQFVLKSYDVDASYDGTMNPIRIYGEGEPLLQ